MRSELRQAARAQRRGLRARPSRTSCGRSAMAGMTLIELLTVVAVLAILSTIAFSSYRTYMVRTNRTDATTALLRVQVGQEKYFLQNNTYTDKVLDKLGVLATTPRGTYELSIAEGSSEDIATSYIATATAIGPQRSDDPKCATMSIDDKGHKDATPGPASLCWR